MNLRSLLVAEADLQEALFYYRQIEPSLANRFLSEVEATIERIARFPLGWRAIDSELRRCVVRGFPYVIIYAVLDEEIVIVAFANTHRQPGYWRERIREL